MQATIESFRQCLVDQGLDVADVTRPTGGGPGAGGPGGAMLTERLAQMLGLDTTDATVAAALDACASTLETT